MAIGTIAAIGLGAAGIGSFLSSKSQSKATSKAAQTAADTSLQVAQQNNALAAGIYNENKTALSPYMARGNAAGDQINALLGIGGPQQPAAPQTAPQVTSLYSGSNPAAAPIGWQAFNNQTAGQSTDELLARVDAMRAARGYAAQNPQPYRDQLLDSFPVDDGPQTQPYAATQAPQAAPAAAQSVASPQAAQSAFDTFRNSTGYQFRLGEGANALNSLYAGSGTLRSGAAARALQDYGQNMASQEFGNYMGYLGNQQGVGLAGASALAGVGQNYANSVMANNQNAGDTAINAALYKAGNKTNPFANTLSLLGGAAFGLAR